MKIHWFTGWRFALRHRLTKGGMLLKPDSYSEVLASLQNVTEHQETLFPVRRAQMAGTGT